MSRTVHAADGKYTTRGVPHGYTSLTPHLVVSPAKAALEFYATVFGAQVSDVMPMGDLVAHAIVAFPSGRLTVSDPMPAYDLIAPSDGGTSFSLALYVPNVDEMVERAIAAGARLREALTTFASGDRFASLLDPFGVRWSLMTRVEDLSPEQSRERVMRWLEEQAKGAG